ncbi:N-methyl-L-tryptophan oxidase [Microbacterium sp. SORGH_AS_0888]|uniref:N-methyl-L-tryptophan oxidase n=1 Tax=Microbacterium sp. SORGH_AS_0888 TaxID=3041791 RepID=UPI00278466AC|nr:N-methyl-L-tryptophan oxidase [Microbacterium sp. SORGH_AS_0888]MDQ1130693.1 sarcosine oxidase [Microbacterium sp. SORGH_AS_0888]
MSEKHFDVIVVGLGPWGSSASWHLARRGKRVLGLDRFTPPHGMGSHGGATRLARQSSSAGVAYTTLTEQTFDLWNTLSAQTGTPILQRTGSIFVGQPGSLWFDKTTASLGGSNFEYEFLDAADARRRFPWMRVGENEVTVWEPNGTVGLVNNGITALQAEAQRLGALLRTDEAVLGWEETAFGVSVTTTLDTYTADRLIVAVGARANDLLQLDLPYKVARQVLANFRNTGEPLPAVYFAKPIGSVEAPAYGCTEPNGDWKFSVPGSPQWIDPESLNQALLPGDIEKIQEVLADRLPSIDLTPLSTTVCMWSEVEDGHWVIGEHPDSDRVIIGTGDMGRGFRYAAVVGEILADYVDGKSRADAALFRPGRFASATA